MARILLAGLIAGIVVFCWGAVTHMVLPLGMVGFRIPPDAAQQATLDGLRERFGDRSGIYMLPVPQQEQWEDEAAMTAFGAAAAQRPYAHIVYQPQGRDSYTGMGPMLAIQFLCTVACGVIAAFLASAFAGRARRVAVVAALAVFGWIMIAVPNWNWYRFPDDYTLAALAEHGIGWLLGGLAIAWVLRPRPA